MRLPRFRVSLRLKTIAFVSVVMIGSAVLLGSAFQQQWISTQRTQFEEHAKARVKAAAVASEYGVLARNLESLAGVIEGLRNEEDILYVFIRDANGETLAETGQVPTSLSPARLAEIDKSALNVEAIAVNPLTSQDDQIGDMEVAVPLFWERPVQEGSAEALMLGLEPEMEQVRIGVIQTGFSVDQLLAQQAEIRRTIGRLTVAVTALAMLLAALLSELIIRPIRRLADATRQVAGGDLRIRVPVSTGDEIGALADAFNLMTDDLRASREELDSYHRTLEDQVSERTEALHTANQELRRINDELERASRLKSEFLANMSHELRTPLNAIIGFSELLSDQVFGPLNDRQGRYVGNVLTSGRHLLNLINEILDLAKVESGKMELLQEPFSPEAAIVDITAIVRSLAHKKRITLRIDAGEPIGIVVADPKRFKQVLYNLLSNAIKFTPEKGTVSVHTSLTPPGPHPQWWEVAVHDTGIGIAPDDQARVFNEFEQLDGSHSREFAGTGLGLALTKKLVELHGGTLTLESTVNLGSTFTVMLPLRRPEGHEAERPAAAGPDHAPVLYAGSATPAVREMVDPLLRDHGFPVYWLDAEDDAVARARELRPCAILLDLTGEPAAVYRLWHTLRGDPDTADMPIILFSPSGVETERFAFCAGARLTKPVVKEQLLDRLTELVPRELSRPGRILIVDDDPHYLEMTADVLEDEGYDVRIATDGAAGIAAIEQHAPDVVLLDLMMPEVNGFEVVSHMRGHPATAGIPIVIVTAKDLTPADISALNGHVASIAQKGLFSREDLLREITEAYTRAMAGS